MNFHSTTYNPNEQLSLDELRAYQANQLSGPARHRVERLMLENPFYADALDGLDALQQHVGGSLRLQTRELHQALQERIHESATPRRLMPLWVTSLAASVLLVLSVSVYLIINTAQQQRQAIRGVSPFIEPGTVLIDPNDLGTSETIPETTTSKVATHPVRPVGRAVKARKKQRPVPVYEEIIVTVGCGDRPLPMAEEPLPQTDNTLRMRHVDPERAFTDWPPSAKTISRW